MSDLEEAFDLCSQVTAVASKTTGYASGIGVFKKWSSRLIRYGETGQLVVTVLQPDGQSSLKKLIAYDNSYPLLGDLLKIPDFTTIEISGFQSLSDDRMQLNKLSIVSVVGSGKSYFPLLDIGTCDSATTFPGLHVLTGLKVRSLKPGSPFVGCLTCHSIASKGRASCLFCYGTAFGMHLTASARIESNEGHVFKCFLDSSTLSRITKINLGKDLMDKMRLDKTLGFLESSVSNEEHCLVLSEQHSKGKPEKFYIVDTVLSSDVVNDQPIVSSKRPRRNR